MNTTTRSTVRWLFAVVAVLIVFDIGASADELTSREFNYGIAIPDGWTVTFQNASGFSIVSADRKRTITLIIQKSGFGMLDSNAIPAIEANFLRAGMTKISTKALAVGFGIPAYQIIQRMGNSPFSSTYLDEIIIVDGRLYDIGALYIGGQVTNDSDIQRAMASFHFLRAPKPPDSRGFKGGLFSLKLVIPAIVAGALLFWIFRRRPE